MDEQPIEPRWAPPADPWQPARPAHPAPPAPPGQDARPIRLVILDPDLRRNRWTVVIRVVLAIPLLIWAAIWTLIAIAVAVITWAIALATGRAPASLQDFFRAYVRFVAHLNAYLSFAAGPYPSFVGKPGYAIDVEIDPTPPLRRWKVLFRLLLALPAIALSSTLAGSTQVPSFVYGQSELSGQLRDGGAIVAVGILGWFVCLVRGRMSAGLRDLAAYAIGYGAQVTGYLTFLTDRYPNADPACVLPPLRVPPHPVGIANGDDPRRARLLVLLRLPLCFPHLVWLSLWSTIVVATSPLVWLTVLLLGRLPAPLHRFLSAWVRAYAQFAAFATLVAGPFPGFVGAEGYPVELSVAAPARQHRAATAFRWLLVLPAQLLATVYTGVLATAAVMIWVAALFTGRAPTGLQALGAAAVRYLAQTAAYAMLVTDRYPHASPGLEQETSEPVDVQLDLFPSAAVA